MAPAPAWASCVCFSKKSSMSSVLMLARHAFFPFRDPFDAFPIAAAALVHSHAVEGKEAAGRGGRGRFGEMREFWWGARVSAGLGGVTGRWA
jgi:hypothetical protein